MAAVETSILTALRDHLVAFARPRALPVAFTNKAFTAPAGGKYLRETFLPNGTSRPFLGSSDPQRLQGLYQIDVVWPQDQGQTAAVDLAGDIADHFATDTRLTSGAVTVRITKRPEVAGMIIDEARTMLPTTIRWESWA